MNVQCTDPKSHRALRESHMESLDNSLRVESLTGSHAENYTSSVLRLAIIERGSMGTHRADWVALARKPLSAT